MSKKLNLFDWEDNQELGDNNLPEEGGIDTNNLNFEDYQQIKSYIPGQTQTFLYDRDKADRAFEAVEDSPRTSFHVGADDVDNLIAINQSTGEKWANGTAKLIGKTATATVGGVSMLFSGIGTTADWLVGGFEGEESWKDIWDNDLQRGLDNINKWMDKELPNYYTKAEQEKAWYKNILGDGAANFWANDVFNGLSFIAGAVLTEVALSAATAATFGAAAPVQGAATSAILARMPKALRARAASTLKNLTRGKAVTNPTRGTSVAEKFYNKAPKLAQKIKSGGLLSRRLLTGAGYESGVEGRHHIDALHSELVSAEEAKLGRPLTDKETADLYDISNASGNAVFLGNLALVGSSNLILFPKIFGSGYRSGRKTFNNVMKDMKSDAAKPFRALHENWSATRKGLNVAYNLSKRGAYEGIVEEGGQAWLDLAGQHSGADFYMKGKRPSQMEAVNGMMKALYKTGEENFSSNQTQKEMGIGFILGAMGLPTFTRQTTTDKDGATVKGKRKWGWTGGAYGSYKDMKKNQAVAEKMAAYANENPDAFEALKANYDMLVREGSITQEQDMAMATNNMFAWKNLEHDRFFNFVNSRSQIGYYNDVIDNIESIRKMDNQEFAEAFGYDTSEMTDAELSARKDKVVDSALKKADQIHKARKTIDRVYRGENDDVRLAMTHALSAVEDVGNREENILNEIDDLTGGKLNMRVDKEGATQAAKDLMGSGTVTLGSAIQRLNKQLIDDAKLADDNPNKMSPERREFITNMLNVMEQGKGELDIANAVDDMAVMNSWKALDPQGYQASPHRDQVRQMLMDLRKLRERRQDAIKMYNELNTVAGENRFGDALEYYADAYSQQQKVQEEKETDAATETGDVDAFYRANSENEFLIQDPKTKKPLLMKFADENNIVAVEDPNIKFSKDLIKTNFIKVVSPTTVEENATPTREGEISVETAVTNDFAYPEKSLRPDFIEVGFGKTAGWLNTNDVEGMSPSQKNFFKYVHANTNFSNVELELVANTKENRAKYPWLDFFDKDDIKAVVVNKKSGRPKKFNKEYVYTSIMLPTMESTTGNERFSGLEGVEQAFIDARIDEFNDFRKTISQNNVRVPITGRSMLFPNYQTKDDRFNVVGRAVNSRRDLADAEIKLAVSDTLPVNGHEYRSYAGLPYIIHNNVPIPLFPRTLTETEIDTITNLLVMYSENISSPDPNIRENPDQILDSEIGRDANLKIIDAIRSMIRFGGYKAGESNPAFQIKLTNKGVELEGKTTLSYGALVKRKPAAMRRLKEFLANKIHDVNNNFLRDNELFYHVTLTEDGLDIQDYTNYKEYLLAPRLDDLDVPYTTNVVPMVTTSNTDAFQYNGGYLMFDIPTEALTPIKEQPRTRLSKPVVISKFAVLKDVLGENEEWILEGVSTKGDPRSARFSVVVKNGITEIQVPPEQDPVYTAMLNELMGPNLNNNEFTLGSFHALAREQFELTTDQYDAVKPTLSQAMPAEVNPFEAVESQTSNTKESIKNTIVDSPSNRSYKGIPVIPKYDIKTKEGTPGIAQRTTLNNEDVIYIDSKKTKTSFQKKAWAKPRKLKDNTYATALPANAFATIREWEDFILEHEYQHTKIKQKKGETLGEYEDRINSAALKALQPVDEATANEGANPFGNTRGRSTKGNKKALDSQRKLKGKYRKIKIEQERAWFEGKFNIPFKTVKGLVSGSNYGEFRQAGEVLVSEMGIEGTAYHEAFHVVHDYFWTPEQKIQIYNDYKKYTKQPNLSNTQVEEQLAEEFRHYMLKDGNTVVPPVKGLKGFFSRLWDFIKSLFTESKYTPEGVRLANMFEAVRTTDYRTPKHAKTALLNKFFLSINPEVKALEATNVTETRAILEGYVNSIFDELDKEESSLHITDLFQLTTNKDVSSEFGVLMDHAFQNMMGVLRNQAQEQLPNGTWVNRTDVSPAEINTIFENARFLNDNKAEIFDLFTDWLESFGVSLEVELNETDAKKENNFGATSQVIETSAKGNAPNVVKLLIASLPINSSTSNIIGLHGIVDYTNIFNSLHNELAGIQTFEGQIAAINNMALNRPDIAEPLQILLKRLKATHEPSQLNGKEFLLRQKFIQQFDKTKNTYYLNLIKDGVTIHTTDSNLTKTEDKIREDWRANFREVALSEKGFLKINDETGGIIIDPKKKFKFGPKSGVTYKTLPKLKGSHYFDFLNLIGINFTNPNALKNNPKAFNELVEQTTYIKNFFLDKQAEDITYEVEDLFRDEDSGVAARLNKLISMELPYYTNTIELQHITPEGKNAYGITLGNFISRVSNSLSKGIIPKYLQDARDVIKGSSWLSEVNNGGGIKVVILEGATKDEKGAVGNVTKDLTPTDRDAMYINNTLNGRYPMLQASEKKTVFGFEVSNKNGAIGAHKINRAKSLNILVNHLRDEIQVTLNLVRDNIGNDIKGFREAGRRLRFFDYLNEMPLADGRTLEQLLQDPYSTLTADDIIKQNSAAFVAAIDANLSKSIASTTNRLVENGMLKMYPSGVIHLYGIDAEIFGKTLGLSKSTDKNGNLLNFKQVAGDKLSLNPNELRQFLDAFTLRDTIAAAEQLKLFFGDVGFFTPDSLYKRTAGPHGVKKFAVSDDFTSEWLRQNVERYDKKTPDGTVRTIMLRDVQATSQYHDDYVKVLGPKVAEAYRNYTESDAQGYITIDEYIEFLARVGDITPQHLDLYQKVQQGEPLTSEEMLYFTPLKPQYYGPAVYKGLYNPAYYKLSLAVLLPQMLQTVSPVTGQVAETSLKRLHDDMVKNQVGIAVFESGIKIGGKVDPETGLAQQFYGRGGRYPRKNIKPQNIQTLYYDYLGIQVDMGNKVKDQVATGTQRRALMLGTLYDNGKPVHSWSNSVTTRFNDIHNALTDHNFYNFVHKLGFNNDLEQIADIEYIKDALLNETRQRKLSDNELEGLEIMLESDDKFLELVSNKPALDSVLHSLFARDVINKKRFGGSYAQVAPTGMEIDNEGRVIAKAMKQRDHVYGTEASPLKFYRMSKNGKEVLGMEVMLPHYFKEFLGTGLEVRNGQIVDVEGNVVAGSELLEVLGFRIPTSDLSTIEVISIKGFLPKEAGEAIMTPSEIVVKAGSDYDIDKLTLLFPKYTTVREGNVKTLKKIPYLDENVEDLEKVKALRKYDKNTYKRYAQEAGLSVDETFAKYFDKLNDELNKTKKDLFDVYNSEEVEKLDGQIEFLKEARAKASTQNKRKAISRQIEDLILDKLSITSGYTMAIDKLETAFDELDKNLAKSKMFKELSNDAKNSTAALENEDIRLSRFIATRPENFKRLITPTGASKLDALAEEIAEIIGEPLVQDLSYSSALEFAHKQEMGKRFWEGMAALGIGAVANTAHVKAQPYNLQQIVPTKKHHLAEIPIAPSDIVDDEGNPIGMVTSLAHNTDNGASGHYITEILGEFINAFVDVAKKPFVFGLNANLETVSTLFSLLRQGASIDTLGKFFMQPILRELVAELPKAKSFVLASRKEDKNRIIKKVRQKYIDKVGKKKLDPALITEQDLQMYLELGANLEQATPEQQQLFAMGQLAVLDMYSAYKTEASKVTALTSALSHDTAPPMNRMHAIMLQDKLKRISGFIGVEEIMEESWMSSMIKASDNLLPLFNDFYLTDTSQELREMQISLMRQLRYNSDQDILKVLNLVENDYITFLMSGLAQNKDNNMLLEDEASRLTQGPNSVARRWRQFQRTNPDNMLSKYLFSELQIHTEPNHLGYKIDSVRAFSRKLTAIDSNLLTEAFMELYNGSIENKRLAEDLVKFAILQSGMNKSPKSFMRIVPATLYSRIAKEVIDKFKVQHADIDLTRFIPQFFKNNSNNDLIVPTVKPVRLTEDMDPEQMAEALPRMENGQLLLSAFDAKSTYVKTFTVDPSLSEVKKARLQKAGKALPKVSKLFKRIPTNEMFPIIIRYEQVTKLGDGLNLKEYSLIPKPSIIPLNNFIPGAPISPKAAPIVDTRAAEEKVLEGDLFTFEGIPVIPINLDGDHSEGIAYQAKKKKLIQDTFDNSYQVNNINKANDFSRGRTVITLPVKNSVDLPLNLDLVTEGLQKVQALAKANPNAKILVPLLRDASISIDSILPILKNLIDANTNISIVIPSNPSALSDRQAEDIQVIKKLLKC